MYPADEFVEDFVGADRALKRLALQRVRDIDLWKAAHGARRRAGATRPARKLDDADIDYRCWSTTTASRSGWLQRARLPGERVTEDLRSQAEPLVELDDVLRDALSRPARERDALRRRGRRARAAWPGCSRSR